MYNSNNKQRRWKVWKSERASSNNRSLDGVGFALKFGQVAIFKSHRDTTWKKIKKNFDFDLISHKNIKYR